MSAGWAAETAAGRHRGAAPGRQVGIGCLQGAGHDTGRRVYNRLKINDTLSENKTNQTL